MLEYWERAGMNINPMYGRTMLYPLPKTTLADAGVAPWVPRSRSRGIGRVAVVGIFNSPDEFLRNVGRGNPGIG